MENWVTIKINIAGDREGKKTIIDLLDSSFKAEFLEIIAKSLRECVEKEKPQTMQFTSEIKKHHMGFIVPAESTP